jgi:hypothetical protein
MPGSRRQPHGQARLHAPFRGSTRNAKAFAQKSNDSAKDGSEQGRMMTTRPTDRPVMGKADTFARPSAMNIARKWRMHPHRRQDSGS